MKGDINKAIRRGQKITKHTQETIRFEWDTAEWERWGLQFRTIVSLIHWTDHSTRNLPSRTNRCNCRYKPGSNERDDEAARQWRRTDIMKPVGESYRAAILMTLTRGEKKEKFPSDLRIYLYYGKHNTLLRVYDNYHWSFTHNEDERTPQSTMTTEYIIQATRGLLLHRKQLQEMTTVEINKVFHITELGSIMASRAKPTEKGGNC
jgi:hypothetical protein